MVGVMAQPKEATDEVTDIDGVSILGGKYAVNADGKVLSPSSQTMPQLKAELTARNLSTEGKRDDLKRRVMVSLPPSSCFIMCTHLLLRYTILWYVYTWSTYMVSHMITCGMFCTVFCVAVHSAPAHKATAGGLLTKWFC